MNRTGNRRKAPADVWALVDRQDPNDCWPFQGRPTTQGYGQISLSGHRRHAHIVVFEVTNGPVPPGHVVDHRCHNEDPHCHGGICPHRMCCNPAHLEAVTGADNMRRSPHHNASKTECINGHPFSPENTGFYRTRGCTARRCLTCARANDHRRRTAATNLQGAAQ